MISLGVTGIPVPTLINLQHELVLPHTNTNVHIHKDVIDSFSKYDLDTVLGYEAETYLIEHHFNVDGHGGIYDWKVSEHYQTVLPFFH